MSGTNDSRRPEEYLLAIESSCDESAAAIIDRDLRVHSSVIASQTALHEQYGGVVPEIASRAHLRRILPVIDQSLSQADVSLDDLTAIAVTTQPGLVGSLLVGLTVAKTLAATLQIPLIPVDHIEAHIYACRMTCAQDPFPAIGLVVSGGHSNLYDCRSAVEFDLLGSTIDDAAGEAFDKVAKILGLAYPGGPAIENASQTGDPAAFDFPRTFIKEDRLDFSFSGIKTAVLYTVNGIPGSFRDVPPLTEQRIADIAAGFQEAVVEVLVAKCGQALRQFDRRTLCVGGGVAANTLLRERLTKLAEMMGVTLITAPREYCTDNAAMAAIAWELLDLGRTGNLDIDVVPGLVRKQT